MIHKFNIDVYKTPLYITYDATEKEMMKMFKLDKYEYDEYTNAYTILTHTKKDDERCIIICFRSKKEMTTQVMAHESAHAALAIYDYFSMDPSGFNNEPFCYLLEYILGQCMKVKEYEQRTNKRRST